jgi:hypothetical protein
MTGLRLCPLTTHHSPPTIHDSPFYWRSAMRCEQAEELTDGRLVSPSAERNKRPILTVLERVLPRTGLVLEIASGTGQHVVYFAHALKRLSWQPTDRDAECRRSISAWIASENLPNVGRPLDLDVRTLPWPVPAIEAVVGNISPFCGRKPCASRGRPRVPIRALLRAGQAHGAKQRGFRRRAAST